MRIDTEELSDVAIHLNLQKKYSIDVDLLDHMVRRQKPQLWMGRGACRSQCAHVHAHTGINEENERR